MCAVPTFALGNDQIPDFRKFESNWCLADPSKVNNRFRVLVLIRIACNSYPTAPLLRPIQITYLYTYTLQVQAPTFLTTKIGPTQP
jgi:hypothetical protein